jgi:hypothetical protein
MIPSLTAVVTHICIFPALKQGLDVTWILDKIGVGQVGNVLAQWFDKNYSSSQCLIFEIRINLSYNHGLTSFQ